MTQYRSSFCLFILVLLALQWGCASGDADEATTNESVQSAPTPANTDSFSIPMGNSMGTAGSNEQLEMLPESATPNVDTNAAPEDQNQPTQGGAQAAPSARLGGSDMGVADEVSTGGSDASEASGDGETMIGGREDSAPPGGAMTAQDDTGGAEDAADGSAEERPEGLSGEWNGYYTCAQGKTGLTLSITHDLADDALESIFSFFPHADNPEVPNGRFEMFGVYDSDSAGVTLTAGEWVEDPGGFATVDLSGRYDPNTDSISGETIGSGCTRFMVLRNAIEICDGSDNDYDGFVDEGFADLDQDGVADCP